MSVHAMRRALTPADLEGMNVPNEFWPVKVGDCAENVVKVGDREEQVRAIVERYLANIIERVEKGQGLILSGPEGVGKSGIAVLILKEARARGFTGYFAPIHELRECVKNRIPYDDGTSVYDRCAQVDVLVLDGLSKNDKQREFDAKTGASRGEHVFGADDITELLITRAQRKKLTVLTTRLSGQELRKDFTDLCSVAEGCMVVVPVSGENRRRRQQEELKKSIFGTG